jgi:hypothetical protein
MCTGLALRRSKRARRCGRRAREAPPRFQHQPSGQSVSAVFWRCEYVHQSRRDRLGIRRQRHHAATWRTTGFMCRCRRRTIERCGRFTSDPRDTAHVQSRPAQMGFAPIALGQIHSAKALSKIARHLQLGKRYELDRIGVERVAGRRCRRDAARSMGGCLLGRVRELHVRRVPRAVLARQGATLFQPGRSRAWSCIRGNSVSPAARRRGEARRRRRACVVRLLRRKRLRANHAATATGLLDDMIADTMEVAERTSGPWDGVYMAAYAAALDGSLIREGVRQFVTVAIFNRAR